MQAAAKITSAVMALHDLGHKSRSKQNICSRRKAKAKRHNPLQMQTVEIVPVGFFHGFFFFFGPVPHVAAVCFRYSAAVLVIKWLSSHEDPTLQRMAVAVISALVAKVKTPLALSALVRCTACRRWGLLGPPALWPHAAQLKALPVSGKTVRFGSTLTSDIGVCSCPWKRAPGWAPTSPS